MDMGPGRLGTFGWGQGPAWLGSGAAAAAAAGEPMELDDDGDGCYGHVGAPPPSVGPQEVDALEAAGVCQLSFSLGSGGFAKVTAAMWRDREVAIKLLSSSTSCGGVASPCGFSAAAPPLGLLGLGSGQGLLCGGGGLLCPSPARPRQHDRQQQQQRQRFQALLEEARREAHLQAKCAHRYVAEVLAVVKSPPGIIMQRCCCSLQHVLSSIIDQLHRRRQHQQHQQQEQQAGTAAVDQLLAHEPQLLRLGSGCLGGPPHLGHHHQQQQQPWRGPSEAEQLRRQQDGRRQLRQQLAGLAARCSALAQAVEALSHVHACGVLHNDVRAANLLVDIVAGPGAPSPSPQPPPPAGAGQSNGRQEQRQQQQEGLEQFCFQLRLSDFGLASEVGSQDQAALTRATHGLWQAPELLRQGSSALSGEMDHQQQQQQQQEALASRQRDQDVRAAAPYTASRATDVFAFGTLMYELLTGVPPWADWDTGYRQAACDRLVLRLTQEVAQGKEDAIRLELRNELLLRPPSATNGATVLKQDPAVQQLWDVLEHCRKWDSKHRPPAEKLLGPVQAAHRAALGAA